MEKKKLQGFFRTDRTMIIFQILSRDQNLHVCNSLEFNQIKKKFQKWNTFNSAISKRYFILYSSYHFDESVWLCYLVVKVT